MNTQIQANPAIDPRVPPDGRPGLPESESDPVRTPNDHEDIDDDEPVEPK